MDTAQEYMMELAGVSHLGWISANFRKNRPSFAIAYSILGWHMMVPWRDAIITIMAINAVITPAAEPITGICAAASATGAEDAVKRFMGRRPVTAAARLV